MTENLKFDIPEKCYIRWQAALAVLEDLQKDTAAPFSMNKWADALTIWEKTNGCGTAACFAGYISVAPYCRALGYPRKNFGGAAGEWLLGKDTNKHPSRHPLYNLIFHHEINKGSRSRTLAYLERTLKSIFKESTGKTLKAPLTFWID